MLNTITLIIEFLYKPLEAIQDIWNRLIKQINKEVARLIFVVITISFIYVLLSFTMLIIIVVLKIFL